MKIKRPLFFDSLNIIWALPLFYGVPHIFKVLIASLATHTSAIDNLIKYHDYRDNHDYNHDYYNYHDIYNPISYDI